MTWLNQALLIRFVLWFLRPSLFFFSIYMLQFCCEEGIGGISRSGACKASYHQSVFVNDEWHRTTRLNDFLKRKAPAPGVCEETKGCSMVWFFFRMQVSKVRGKAFAKQFWCSSCSFGLGVGRALVEIGDECRPVALCHSGHGVGGECWLVCVCRPVALCHLGHGVGGVLSGVCVCVCVCVGPWRHATRAMALEELCECVCVCVSVCFLIQRVRSGIRWETLIERQNRKMMPRVVVPSYVCKVPEQMATVEQPLEKLERKSDLVPAARPYFRAWRKKELTEVHSYPIYWYYSDNTHSRYTCGAKRL